MRSYNPVRKIRVVEDQPKLIDEERVVEVCDDILAVPGRSECVRTPSPGSIKEPLQDTPRKKILKRKIAELQGKNVLKSRKIRSLQKVVWRQKKVITSLKAMTVQLKKKNLLFEEQGNVLLEQFGTNKDIIERLFRKTVNKKVRRKFEHSVRAFAVTLHFYSPKAYNFVRQKFHNSLPHPKTLAKWYCSVDAKPGFTTEAFNFLKTKVAHTNKNALICSLVFDEIAIRQHLEYCGGSYYGYVDCGNALHGDCMELAKEALVFMLVCINEAWKIPLGYFFISGINSEQKLSLLKQALTLLKDVGVIITNVTFDGCAANFGICNLLNCRFNKTNVKVDFVHDNNRYFLLPDPVHMLKLIRNCFGEKRRFIDVNGGCIDFDFLIKLNNLQLKEGLHLGTKLRNQHINFFKQKMKVKLATQLLSRSVSDALLFCRDRLHIKEFENCGPTAEFILLINDAFDILNSRKITDFGFKQAACSSNINNIKNFSKNFHDYICSLKFTDGLLVVDSQRKAGFIGLLMDLKSLLGIYEEYVAKGVLKFIPAYKINQDHIELFFGAIRSQGGYNNNPTSRQFSSAYKKILIHAEVRDEGAGNCIPLEQINILNVASTNKTPEQIINESVPNRLNDDFDDTEISNFLTEHDYAFNFNSLSQYSMEVIKYISGFVSYKLGNKLQCEHCISQLYGEKENFLDSLISHKSMGGLTYPSTDVIKICVECEKLLRIEQISNKYKINKSLISSKLLQFFIQRNIFSNMLNHDLTPLESHKILLIKSICNSYLDIRIHFICKQVITQEKIRNMYTKLILFKGQ